MSVGNKDPQGQPTRSGGNEKDNRDHSSDPNGRKHWKDKGEDTQDDQQNAFSDGESFKSPGGIGTVLSGHEFCKRDNS